MREIEFVQSAYNGGFPDGTGVFKHGEPLRLVSALELKALRASLAAAEREVARLKEGYRISEMNRARSESEVEALRATSQANLDSYTQAHNRALAAERARDEAVAALREIVAEWEKDVEGAEECFPLLARARAVLEGGAK